MIGCQQGVLTSRLSTSKFNVKVKSQKIQKIYLLKRWEATFSNKTQFFWTRKKTLVVNAESPVTEWLCAIADRPLGNSHPILKISRLQSHRLPHRLSLVTRQRFDSFGIAITRPHRISFRSSSKLIWDDIAATLRASPRTFRRLLAQQSERSLRAVFFNCCKWCWI